MTKNIVCPHCLQVNKIPADKVISKANCGKCKESLLDTYPKEVDAEAFNKHVVNNDILVVADFFAHWCGPCKALAPVFERVAASLPLRARFIKIDTDKQNALAGGFAIRGVPTMILFKGGKEVERISGALGEGELKNFLQRHI